MKNLSIELEIESRWRDWFLVCESVTSVAVLVERTVEIDGSNEKLVVLFAVYAKILKSYFSALKLIKSGYGQDAGAVARVVVETLFVLKASYLDEEFYRQYKSSAEIERKRCLIGAKEHAKRKNMSQEYIDELDEEISAAGKNIKEGNIIHHSVKNIAKTAKLEDMYDITYRNLCTKCSHPSPWCLNEHLKEDVISGEYYVLFGPSPSDVGFILFSLAQSVLIASDTMSKLFSLQLDFVISVLYKHVMDLEPTLWR